MRIEMRVLATIITGLLFLGLAGQENRLLVMGEIRSGKDSALKEGVVVLCKDPMRQSVSDKKGRYAILVDYRAGTALEFHFVGFKTVTKIITASVLQKAFGDTLRLNVVMEAEGFLLPEAPIYAKTGPDTVVGNWHFFIEDYMFLNDSQFILLTFEKTLKQAKVMLAGKDEKILGSFSVPGEAISLQRDFKGRINVLCRDSAFRVKIVPPATVLLLALPYKDFCERVLPVVDTINGRILFSNYFAEYPEFSYFSFNLRDTSVGRIHTIVDRQLLEQYNWEFDNLLPKDRLYARKMEAYTGIDKRMIAATMTGYPKSIFYTPLYAPMYVVHDTICIFDHYADTLFLYDRDFNCIGASKIDYHHPKNWKEWDRQILKDEITGEIYAQFEKDGFYTLKKIDIATGKVTGVYQLQNHYVKHIRIRNGGAYYIHQPFDSIQKKYLYREGILLR
jgi:hypothetical protein